LSNHNNITTRETEIPVEKETETMDSKVKKLVENKETEVVIDEVISEKEKTVTLVETKPSVQDEVFLFRLGENEDEFYSYSPFFVNSDNSIAFKGVFKKGVMSESVLGKRLIQAKYYENVDGFTELPLKNGIYIKLVKYEKWMSLSEGQVKEIFEKTVLKEYREINKTVKTQTPVKNLTKTKEQVINFTPVTKPISTIVDPREEFRKTIESRRI
jgi:hypothetical protein